MVNKRPATIKVEHRDVAFLDPINDVRAAIMFQFVIRSGNGAELAAGKPFARKSDATRAMRAYLLVNENLMEF